MDKFALARVIIFVFAWINSLLVAKGLPTLPVVDEAWVATGIALVVSIWTLARDNKLKKPVDKTTKKW